jgi:hypothetical protein
MRADPIVEKDVCLVWRNLILWMSICAKTDYYS